MTSGSTSSRRPGLRWTKAASHLSDSSSASLPVLFELFSFAPRRRGPRRATFSLVIAGLDPGIHASVAELRIRMDCRVKPGNDEDGANSRLNNSASDQLSNSQASSPVLFAKAPGTPLFPSLPHPTK